MKINLKKSILWSIIATILLFGGCSVFADNAFINFYSKVSPETNWVKALNQIPEGKEKTLIRQGWCSIYGIMYQFDKHKNLRPIFVSFIMADKAEKEARSALRKSINSYLDLAPHPMEGPELKSRYFGLKKYHEKTLENWLTVRDILRTASSYQFDEQELVFVYELTENPTELERFLSYKK